MPKKVSLNELKEKMGDDVVKKLHDEFAGRIIYLSKKGIEFPSQEMKEQYIFNCFYESNVTYPELAKRVGLSEDRIRKIVTKKREEWLEKHRKNDKDDNN